MSPSAVLTPGKTHPTHTTSLADAMHVVYYMIYFVFRDQILERTCGCDEGYLHGDHAGIDGRLQVGFVSVLFLSFGMAGRAEEDAWASVTRCRPWVFYLVISYLLQEVPSTVFEAFF